MDESQYIKSIKFKHNVNRFDLQVGSTELKISSKIIESRGNIWQDVINGGTCERYCQTVFIIRETEFAVSILSEEEYKTITTLWWFRSEVRRTIVPMGYLKIVTYLAIPLKYTYCSKLYSLFNFGKSEHITPVLYYFHWIPVK